MESVAADSGAGVIEGVSVLPLRQFADGRGTVYLMLKTTDPHFLRFGEIYFSTVHRGVAKAWKCHRRSSSNYACDFGRIRLVLYDEREGSSTKGVVQDVIIGPDNYALLVVPPGVWNGFQGLSDPYAILANCLTEPYDPAEFERLDSTDRRIPYEWPR